MLTRNSGYLDLDSYFSGSLRRLKSSPNFKQFYYQYIDYRHLDINCKVKNSFYLKFDDEWHFLKQMAFPGIEMIVDEFLKLLNLDYHEYDVAKLNKKKYSISKSYLKEGMNCLYGAEVINRFCQSVPKSYFKDVGIPNNFYLDYNKEPFEAVNTLTLIEDALYMLLKDVPDNKIIVEKLMKKFSIHYVLSILLTNNDFSSFNWQIIEYNGDYDLIFLDNARCFSKRTSPVKLGAAPQDVYDKLSFFESLDNFFKVASLDNIAAAKEIISKATPELFAQAVKNYENKVQGSPELCIYNDEILQIYNQNYQEVLKIMKEHQLLQLT